PVAQVSKAQEHVAPYAFHSHLGETSKGRVEALLGTGQIAGLRQQHAKIVLDNRQVKVRRRVVDPLLRLIKGLRLDQHVDGPPQVSNSEVAPVQTVIDPRDAREVPNATGYVQGFVVASPGRRAVSPGGKNRPQTFEDPRLNFRSTLIHRSVALQRLLRHAERLRLLGDVQRQGLQLHGLSDEVLIAQRLEQLTRQLEPFEGFHGTAKFAQRVAQVVMDERHD